MLDRVLHGLLQLLLDLLETTNIVPLDGRNLNDSLTQCRRVRVTKSEPEVLHRDTQGIEHLRIDRIFVKVNEIHLLTNLLHGRFWKQRNFF